MPLPEFLLPYLARQCEGKSRHDLLWSGDDGGHLKRPHPTSGWFAKAVAESGIPLATPHDLRHTAASLAVSAGANVKAVQKMLGHASAAMTLDIYADLFNDDLEAVDRVGSGPLARLCPKCVHGALSRRSSRPTDRPQSDEPDPQLGR